MKKVNNSIIDEKLNGKKVKRVGDYISSKTPIEFECTIDGFKWNVLPSDIITNKSGCPKCGGCLKKTNEQVSKELKEKNIIILEEYKNNYTKIRFKCLIDGCEWITIPRNVIKKGGGCPSCFKKRQHNNYVYTTKQVEDKLIGRNIILVGDYFNSETKTEFQCLTCSNVWMSLPTNIFKGHGCPFCKNKKEKEAMQLIKETINYDILKPHEMIKIDNNRYFVDFYLELHDKKLIIERNGEQHYRPINFGQGDIKSKIDYERQITRDETIEQYCKNNSILFFIIPYWWSKKECINNLKELDNEWFATPFGI